MKNLTIITVNYNGYSVTCQLLDSLLNVGFVGQVIVVDNGSTNNEATMISYSYPWVEALRSPTNLGFAGGNNFALPYVRSEYVMFINNDTVVTENFDGPIIEFFETHPKVGAVSPKICFEYAPDVIQFAGYTPLSRVTLRNSLVGFREHDKGQYDVPRPTPYLHGAAMVVRRSLIVKVGGMWKGYFLYYEELDWSIRIARAGWEIWYLPYSTIFHKESWSTGGRLSPLKNYYMVRNRLIFARRNLRGVYRPLSITYQMAVAIPRNLFTNLIHRRWELVGSTLKALTNYVTDY